jgi:SPX domain protein involved in polyphosphate accumulation
MIKKKESLHFRRFEFKYHLPRKAAYRMIPQMLNYMDFDPYMKDEDGYEVTSMYLDSPDLKSYHEKVDGLMNRKKVRIRTYKKDWGPNEKMFFELKRRSGEVILKDRAIIPGSVMPQYFDDPFALQKLKDVDQNFINEFLWEETAHQMRPSVIVNYRRKAFYSKFDRNFRVTFDHDLAFGGPNKGSFDVDFIKPFPELVILEVKFNGAMPRWFHDIIDMYSLQKDVFSKFCAGIEAIYGEPDYF